MKTNQIVSKNSSNIISTGSNSNVSLFKDIILPNLDIPPSKPQPGDIVRCPNGNYVLVDQYGNYYCNIDENGAGLYPFTSVDCIGGATSTINVNGNIIGGCQPANGTEVTCYAGFTAIVENGQWDCGQGTSDLRTYNIFVSDNAKNSIQLAIYTYDYNNDRYIGTIIAINKLTDTYDVTVDVGTTRNMNGDQRIIQYIRIESFPRSLSSFRLRSIGSNTFNTLFLEVTRTGQVILELADAGLQNGSVGGSVVPVRNLPSGRYLLCFLC